MPQYATICHINNKNFEVIVLSHPDLGIAIQLIQPREANRLGMSPANLDRDWCPGQLQCPAGLDRRDRRLASGLGAAEDAEVELPGAR